MILFDGVWALVKTNFSTYTSHIGAPARMKLCAPTRRAHKVCLFFPLQYSRTESMLKYLLDFIFDGKCSSFGFKKRLRNLLAA